MRMPSEINLSCKHLRGVGIVTRQNPRAVVQDRHVGPEAPEDLP